MDERDVWGEYNPLKRWAQNFIAELVIAAVAVFDVDVHAAFWAVEPNPTAQSKSEWPYIGCWLLERAGRVAGGEGRLRASTSCT